MVEKIKNFFYNRSAERLGKLARLWAVLFPPVGFILAIASLAKYGTDRSDVARAGRISSIASLGLAVLEWKIAVLWWASVIFLLGRYVCRYVLSPAQYAKLRASVLGITAAAFRRLGLVRQGSGNEDAGKEGGEGK